MCPKLELRPIHPELAAGNLADLLVHAPQLEFAYLEAHRRAAVAAPARLMKHDGAVGADQLLDQPPRRQRHTDSFGILGELIVQASPPRSGERTGIRILLHVRPVRRSACNA